MDNAHQAKLDAERQRLLRLPSVWQTAIALGIFIAARGFYWRDGRGYHARLYAKEPFPLLLFEILWEGKIHPLARGKVVCNMTKKEHVLDMAKGLHSLRPAHYKLLPDPKPVGRPKNCKHCGNSVNNHDPECYDAVRE